MVYRVYATVLNPIQQNPLCTNLMKKPFGLRLGILSPDCMVRTAVTRVTVGMKKRGARGSPTDRGLPHFRVHWRLLVAAAGNQTETSTGGLTLEPETAEDYQPAKMQRKSTSIQVIKNSCGIDTESSRLKP